ncbi:MAG: UDP-N-acetylmuramate--L-alanine ligase [Patescibacteria group bacterium]|jgi:UDP-N-acetylmuramate--alanine ligase
MDFSKIKKIYMIGIKGTGMAALGQYLSEKGFEVIGSDTAENYSTTADTLKNSKIKVIDGFDEKNIPSDAGLIIYSTAYNAERNVEVAKALSGKIKTLTYPEALGAVFNSSYGIAVAGSHGKTTTTAWLGFVAREAGMEPSVMNGSFVPQFGGNSLAGKSDYLIVEVDEYQNKLQHYNPKAVLLNNIDYDHPDFFPDPESYEKVFIDFIKKIPKKGFLVANFDDSVIKKVARVNCQGKIITYALENSEADFIAYDIRTQGDKQYFKVKARFNNKDAEHGIDSAEELGDFSTSLMGQHNIYNGLAVIAASIELGLDLHKIREYLGEFKGTARRMELLGQFNGADIYDDYAHHPTEIKTTLLGLKESQADKNLVVVFHPHTFTRTKALLDDFAKAFGSADELIVLDIYGSAREKQGGVHTTELIEKIKNENLASQDAGHDTGREEQVIKYIPALEECEKYLRARLRRGDLCVLMGAGDVFRIGENLLKDI